MDPYNSADGAVPQRPTARTDTQPAATPSSFSSIPLPPAWIAPAAAQREAQRRGLLSRLADALRK